MVVLVLMRPLLPIDETRYLTVAWEMHLSGDPFHLTRNFEPYSHKPPLLFWLINLVWSVTGVSELAGRLIGPLCALAAVAATGGLARRLWPGNPEVAIGAMIVTASFSVFAIFGSATMFDALLSLIVLVGMGVIWRLGQGHDSFASWLALGVVIGFGVLAKGPVILVHLAPVLVTWPLWSHQRPGYRQILRGTGLALAAALGLVLLWLGPALLLGDASYREDLIWTQTVDRVTGQMGHGRPVWFLVALLPLIVFPWGWSWRLWRAVPDLLRQDPAARFCLIWAVGGLVLFSLIGGKQVHYLLPELPALGLLLARVWTGAGRSAPGGSAAPVLLLVLALAAAAVAFGMVSPEIGGGVGLGRAAAAGFALCCLFLAVLGWRLPSGWGHAVQGLGPVAALHLLLLGSGAFAAHDAGPIGRAIAARAETGVAVWGMPYNADFNFAGRLTQAVATPRTEDELRDWIVAHPDGSIVGPVGAVGMGAQPDQTWVYRGRPFGLWSVGRLAALDRPRPIGQTAQHGAARKT